MGKQEKDVQTNYHIRFNAKNGRHLAAAAFLASVKGKYKIAFIAAAVEAYRNAHPHGVDYAELEEIQKQSWRPFAPKIPILENLRQKRKLVEATPAPEPPVQEGGAPASEAIDKAMSFYDIE